jgi:hypothetical protein
MICFEYKLEKAEISSKTVFNQSLDGFDVEYKNARTPERKY